MPPGPSSKMRRQWLHALPCWSIRLQQKLLLSLNIGILEQTPCRMCSHWTTMYWTTLMIEMKRLMLPSLCCGGNLCMSCVTFTYLSLSWMATHSRCFQVFYGRTPYHVSVVQQPGQPCLNYGRSVTASMMPLLVYISMYMT